MLSAKYIRSLNKKERRRLGISVKTRLSKAERASSFYYKDVAETLNIPLSWIMKLPFTTARWAYFRITRKFVYLPEDRYQEAIDGLSNWFKTEVFDKKGNLKPRKTVKGGENI